ncbi:putative pentatricopeptide repeat-containing protein [Hibiscus syriacus]|uniref:Pentatricopeptide repeat-containing protein n=1 Tax=Hibiscus syriacus TaxID=106335 RepID=A0A6A3B604_HIBSY|nr:putative pentatricopeptide repeat-containing protein [Hibiscus syriacus]
MAPVPSFPIKVGHIDDVQELNKAKPTTVPERFVQDMADRPKLTANLSSSTDIPIIDLSKLMKGDTDEHFREVMQLKTACEEWGFFQVLNHGVDLNVLENMEKLAKDFFMLPLHEKQKYPMAPGTVQGYGQAFVFSENQKLDWCNMFALGVEPPYSSAIYSSEPWIKMEIFDEMFGVAVQAVRMNYYPPCSSPDLVLGLSPHSDGSALTVLQQGKDSTVGLQILKNQTWLPVQPVPNALVINIGDTLEVLTNGKYKSVEHRAVTHKDKDRLSIVTFYAPSYDIELSPMPELVDEKNPCRYRRYNHGEYNKHYVPQVARQRTLDFAKIHPVSQINKGSILDSPT